jgi:RNase P/RNase MRP subunit p30
MIELGRLGADAGQRKLSFGYSHHLIPRCVTKQLDILLKWRYTVSHSLRHQVPLCEAFLKAMQDAKQFHRGIFTSTYKNIQGEETGLDHSSRIKSLQSASYH